jgi:type II secretory ATPase GspE/PulE/Tfp pilus assembly ATPase PilB-like protein
MRSLLRLVRSEARAELRPEKEGRIGALVRSLVDDAIARSASDLHLDPADGATRCRLRVDGRFEDGPPVEAGVHDRIVARLKVLAGLPVYRRDEIQEGAIRWDEGIDLRVSIVPTIAGEKATLRIFDPRVRPFRIDELGYREAITRRLEKLADLREGAVLLCGPSGSGKTTTAYALLQRIRDRRGDAVNVCTVEDPVEFALGGVHQVSVRRDRDLTFSRVLAALLRQDPEVLLVGEVRDAETARIAVEAGMTGHLVLSSLHAGRAGEALTRLLDLGVDPRLMVSSVRAVVAQRLLRRTCSPCAGAGCDGCRNTGFRGRLPVAELLEVDREVASGVLAGEDATALEHRVADGCTLAADAADLVRCGLTTAAEVERVLGPSEARS